MPLHEGETLIGRGEDCHLCILSSLISRHHAILTNSGGRVTISDGGSRNGVFVNGIRLEAPGLLEDGDSILLGTTELSFFYAQPDDAPSSGRVIMDDQGNLVAPGEELPHVGTATLVHFDDGPEIEIERDDITIEGRRPPPPRSSTPVGRSPVLPEPYKAPATSESGAVLRATAESGKLPKLAPLARIETSSPPIRPSTQPAPSLDALETVFGVVDRMLARGDLDAAARTLGAQLDRRIEAAKSGRLIERDLVEAAALRSLSFVELTGDPSWFARTVDLFVISRRPMSEAVLDELEPIFARLPLESRRTFALYQNLIRELLSVVEVDELPACERILALG